jgi:hypothetical protein
MFGTRVVEKNKTYNSGSITYFFEYRTVYEICGKIFRAGQAKDDNMVHAHCMLDA